MDDNANKNRHEYLELLNRIDKKGKKQEPAPVDTVEQDVKAMAKELETVEVYPIDINDIKKKAESEGIKVKTAIGSAVSQTQVNRFNLGKTLFLSATIVFFIILAEALSLLIIRSYLPLNITFFFAVLYIDFAFLALFAILFLCKVGKTAKVRNNISFLSASVIGFVVAIITVFFFAVLFDINFYDWQQCIKWLLLPITFTTNLPIFASIYLTLKKKELKKEV